MGYTHYWYKVKEVESKKWDSLIQDFDKVLPNFVNLLDTTNDQKLQHDGDILYFNGIGENSHETFCMERVKSMESYIQYHNEQNGGKTHIFDFCKTARKPYDIAVCSALIIAKKKFGNNIKVSSDGGIEEWQEAQKLCQRVLGYGMKFDIEKGIFRKAQVETELLS